MANATAQPQPNFYDTLMDIIENVFKTIDIQYHYKNGENELPTGCTVYNIQTFDDKPIRDALQLEDAPSGWICILESSATPAEDAKGNPQYTVVDGAMVAKTRPPHVYIGSSKRGKLEDMRNIFTVKGYSA